MSIPRSVLFVCTGNQCRSPAADIILGQLVREAGLDVAVSSAGTAAYWGEFAQEPTAQAARELGYDLAPHRSQPVTEELLQGADVILAMARRHQQWLMRTAPEAAARVHLFKPYCLGRAEQPDDDIPDPVGRPLDVHRECVGEIESLLRLLVRRWQAG